MKKWLFNPFVYIAGTKALIIGWVIMLATAFLGYLTKVHFDGIFDEHIFKIPPSYLVCVIEELIDWICVVASFYVLGRIVSDTSIRLIDIAGTMALARWVMLPMTLTNFIPDPARNVNPDASIKEMEKVALDPLMILQSLIVLPLIVWLIALHYNAYSVSANLKGQKAVWTFIAGLIIAEILSKVIVSYLPF
jgi:hypothetical protein